jgi:hypothetical protein
MPDSDGGMPHRAKLSNRETPNYQLDCDHGYALDVTVIASNADWSEKLTMFLAFFESAWRFEVRR